MTTKKEVLKYLYKNYIIDTASKAIVTDKTVVLCLLTNQVNKAVFDCRGLSKIYKNKNAKRGDWLLVKEIKNELYICSLGEEIKEDKCLEVATAFRLRKEKYLKSYELLWSWEDDIPPS